MLTGIVRGGTVAAAAMAVVLWWPPVTVHAGGGTGGVNCGSNPVPGCDVHAGTPGSGSSEGGNGGSDDDGKCHDPSGVLIPCERDDAWAGGDGCYYKPFTPSPETIAALGGQPDGEGGWYVRTCYGNDGGALGGPVWIAGAPPVVSPEVLARQARASLVLPDMVIRFNPAGDQLVRLPTWLSLATSSWEEQSATAEVPGVSVTATARPARAVWSMGDGRSVTCAGPGAVWRPGTDPVKPSPDCGHTYRRSSASAPGAAFVVRATVYWTVTWVGAGRSGTVPGLTTTGSVSVRVAESQALITG